MSRAIAAPSTSGPAQFSNRRRVFMPRTMMAISSTQKMAKDSHWVHGEPPKDGLAAGQPRPAAAPTRVADEAGPGATPAVPGDRADQGVEPLAADPGLDAEPGAGDQGPQDGGQVGPAQPERGTREHRVRDAVLGPG